jgi:hypothetical protein
MHVLLNKPLVPLPIKPINPSMNKNNKKKKDPVKITRNSQLEQQLKIKLSKIANIF